MVRHIKIVRNRKLPEQVLGTLTVLEGDRTLFTCHTLELPWKNNRVKQSHIPAGTYRVTKRQSPKFGNHFHILGVPGRSYILIHAGNFYIQIEGCILVGKTLADLNADGISDVTHSKETLNQLLALMPQEFTLQITEAF